jgi:hypothetical protein
MSLGVLLLLGQNSSFFASEIGAMVGVHPMSLDDLFKLMVLHTFMRGAKLISFCAACNVDNAHINLMMHLLRSSP